MVRLNNWNVSVWRIFCRIVFWIFFQRIPACRIVIYWIMKLCVVYLHILEACVWHNLTSQKNIVFLSTLFLFFLVHVIFCRMVSSFLSYSLHTSFPSSFLFLFLPISRYDFLLPFFLFLVFFLVTFLRALLLFLPFLPSYVCMNLRCETTGIVHCFQVVSISASTRWCVPGSNLDLPIPVM